MPIQATPMGSGFFIFFNDVIDNGSGGYYKPLRGSQKRRTLKPLSYYEEKVKKLLEEERKDLLEAKQDLILKKESLETLSEEALGLISIKEKIIEIEQELKITEANLTITNTLALILRDDDEVLLILNS